MKRSGILVATAAPAAALPASESQAASKGRGGIYSWCRYGYNFSFPYGATVPTEYVVGGRTVALAWPIITKPIVCMVMTALTAVLSCRGCDP